MYNTGICAYYYIHVHVGKALYGSAVGRVLDLEADALMGGGFKGLLAFTIAGGTRSHLYFCRSWWSSLLGGTGWGELGMRCVYSMCLSDLMGYVRILYGIQV